MIDMPKKVVWWYQLWISAHPESWHENDLERFYLFVSVLLSTARKERSRYWLEENLKEDCIKLSDNDIKEYCDIYDHLKGFKNVWKSQQAVVINQSIYKERMRMYGEEKQKQVP